MTVRMRVTAEYMKGLGTGDFVLENVDGIFTGCTAMGESYFSIHVAGEVGDHRTYHIKEVELVEHFP